MNLPQRIGAVSYLNTKPLICDLAELLPDAEVVLATPSTLADQLAQNRLDVALIPAIEYFRGPPYTIIPDIAIASRGPVLSVTLFSRCPPDAIRTMALDTGSRTSAALVQILLQKRYQARPQLRPLAPEENPEQVDADAVLLIGDRAMQACLPGFRLALDLGQEWFDWTGLPFVYAFWAARSGARLEKTAWALAEAKKRGCARAGAIAQEEAPRLGLDAGLCRRYLANILHFDLGPKELAGLERFYELACELELAPKGRELEFHGQKSLAKIR